MMQAEDTTAQALVKNMNAVNPQPGPDALSITAICKRSGRITGYKLSNGQVVDKDQGVRMAKDNMIRGVAVATRKDSEYLRAMPDQAEDNNLGSLPVITQ